MDWITALRGALADLTPENEDSLIWLLNEPQFVSFFSKAFGRLTPAQQQTAMSTAKAALDVFSPRLQGTLTGFAQKIGSTGA